LAPTAPKGPPQFEVYRLLQSRHCDAVVTQGDFPSLAPDVQTLYRGASEACRAAFGTGDQSERWAAATRSYDAVAPHAGSLSCFDVATLSLLKLLLDQQRRNPGDTFEVSTASNVPMPSPPRCPTITRLDPSSGPPGTTTPVTIRGTNLDQVQSVSIVYDDGSEQDGLKPARTVGTLVVAVTPPAAGVVVACINVVTEPNWKADGKLFSVQASTRPTGTATPAGFNCPPQP
jgi:hypothetical protein